MAPTSWSQDEDIALTKAFYTATEDPIHGASQTEGGLWKNVISSMKQMLDTERKPYTNRTRDSVQSRWKKQFFPQLNKWNSAIKEAARHCSSGSNLVDEYTMATNIYRTNTGKSFGMSHCWEVCKDWVIFSPNSDEPITFPTQSASPSSHSTDFSPSYIPQPYVLSDELLESTSTPTSGRPTGTKKSRRGKGKALPSINEEYMAHLQESATIQQVAEDGRMKRHADMVANQNWEKEHTIMTMDTSTLTPGTKEFWSGKRK
ncbi:hypothetical protein ABFX02_10G102900 [Erythranthe guttata]